ncbi:MAG: hypothetical protein HFP78_03210 [Methylococcales symbiont of Hymedesmia sp. n. MRB-2018]|nr:MAG: hypothetical protein HFP78_03210 [Methylococcales symbiont of Hymedesmia sp. n. MRB-2018]
MNEYIKKLEALDKDDSVELISNGSEEHAIELIKMLLTNAKKNVNIISSKLSLYSDSSVIEALKIALKNGVVIKLLLDNYKNSDINKENIFLKTCKEHKNCTVKTYSQQLKAHIITRDGKAFRYCEKLGSNTAVASFNYPSAVKNADEKVFGEDGIFSNAPSFS